MKKAAIAAAVVVLAGGGYLGATAYTGNKIADAYEARIAKLEQFPFMRVVDRQTTKGLFSSTYSGSIRIGCKPEQDLKDDKQIVIGFKDHVRNGPLPGFAGFGAAIIDSEIILPTGLPEAVNTYWGRMKPEDIRTRFSYGGDFKTSVRLPSGDFALPDEGKLTWPEIRIAVDGKGDGSSANVDATVPEFRYVGVKEDKETSVKLVNLRWQGRSLAGQSAWLRPGDSTVEIERVELLSELGSQPFSAQVGKLKQRTELRADKDLLDSKTTFNAEATLKFGAEDAKVIQLDNIEMQESMKHLHAPTLQKVIDKAMADMSPCDGKEITQENAAERSMALVTTLGELLPYAPEYALDKFAVTYEGQRGELSYSASAPGFTAQDIESPMAIQAKLQTNMVLKANGKLPVVWIEKIGERTGDKANAAARVAQINSMLEFVVAKGFAVRDGEFLTSAASFEKGAIMLNGKPMGGSALP